MRILEMPLCNNGGLARRVLSYRYRFDCPTPNLKLFDPNEEMRRRNAASYAEHLAAVQRLAAARRAAWPFKLK